MMLVQLTRLKKIKTNRPCKKKKKKNWTNLFLWIFICMIYIFKNVPIKIEKGQLSVFRAGLRYVSLTMLVLLFLPLWCLLYIIKNSGHFKCKRWMTWNQLKYVYQCCVFYPFLCHLILFFFSLFFFTLSINSVL